MKLVHGGDTVGYRERYGHDALDFSANVGARTSACLGFSARASRKIKSAAPFPQRIHALGTASVWLSAAVSARQSGSGY